jgi:hypothetical protein
LGFASSSASFWTASTGSDWTRLDQQARVAAAQIGFKVQQTVNRRLNDKAAALGRLFTVAEMVPDLSSDAFAQIAERMLKDLDATEGAANNSRAAVTNTCGLTDIKVAPVQTLYPKGAAILSDPSRCRKAIMDIPAAQAHRHARAPAHKTKEERQDAPNDPLGPAS